MKVLFKNSLFTFILGMIMMAGIGVCAVVVTNGSLVVSSSDVTYSSTNVQAAINDLYSKVGNGGPILDSQFTTVFGKYVTKDGDGTQSATFSVTGLDTTKNYILFYFGGNYHNNWAAKMSSGIDDTTATVYNAALIAPLSEDSPTRGFHAVMFKPKQASLSIKIGSTSGYEKYYYCQVVQIN